MRAQNQTSARGAKHERRVPKIAGILLALLLAFPLVLAGCFGGADASTASDASGGTDTQTALGTSDTADPADAADTEGTELEILGFSAGKADAFLLTTPNSAVVIDCGEKGFGKTILAELEARGITSLDCLIITHFDQDHVGGAAKVLNNIPVSMVLQSNSPKDSSEYEKYVKALNNASIEPLTVRETYTFTLDGVRYSVDPPRKSSYLSDSSNNSSLIVTVENGEDNFLFMGDAQTERLEEFLSWNGRTYDVLKVPHHGKSEPLMAELAASVQAEYAVITSSDEEPEDAKTVAILENAGAEVYLTRTAPVVLTSGADGLRVEYTDPVSDSLLLTDDS